MTGRWRLLSAVALTAALAACSGPDKPKPTPLESLTPTLKGKQIWTQRIGDVKFPLSVATAGNRIALATSGGDVFALDPADGHELWRADVGSKIAAGVGSDGRYASVVTTENELVVLDSGKPLWRKRLGGRVVTAPLVAGERVFVLGVDRAVQAFDVLDGRLLWVQRRQGDPLTLMQPGVLIAWRDTLVVGHGARLVGLDPLQGTIRWETAVAAPRGANEVERLADLVGPAARVDESVCARAFQSAVGCVNAERGVLSWTKNVGGVDGLSADTQYVFGADSTDRITAWKRSNGEVAWTSERFLYRGLSAPIVVGRSVVFGDEEGYMHFLDRDSGQPLLRVQPDGKPIAAAPVRLGAMLVAVTRGGTIYAFQPE
ncbi:MAG TPA: outer membrane protein assembly factor BamB [Burkholderiaceae bacterium]|jgi:outer membrane assembly lipoprotein YfgL|nr:outer membrane protein assembly factor BamB [Burkholderiaceae bacterium]